MTQQRSRVARRVGASPYRRRVMPWVAAVAVAVAAGCRGELLGVPVPLNQVPGTELGDSAGGEALRSGAIGLFTIGVASGFGAAFYSGSMADEFYTRVSGPLTIAADSRTVQPGGPTALDRAYIDLQKARIESLQAAAVLEHRAASVSSGDAGEAFAIAGYAEVLLAEYVCSGVPVSQISVTGTAVAGEPLTTDSLLGIAIAHFDSAAAYSGGSALIANLAATGRGRALLDLARTTDAVAAVAQVAPTFLYAVNLPTGVLPDIYHFMATGNIATMADQKGVNGLPFISAHDARLQTAVSPSVNGFAPDVYPVKFSATATANASIPLADGVEAGLIAAEGALVAGNTAGWLAGLNTLRANFTTLRGSYPTDTSYHQLQPLADPGSDSARVTLTFRERAFWLYGTGHRLGDLRRLVRWYGRDQATVFPTGPYINGTANNLVANYGTDVNFPIGTVESANPHFHGCLSLGA